MRKLINNLLYSSNFGFIIARISIGIKHFFSYRVYLSDKAAIKRQFYKAHGYQLDIKNVKTINEKMQWLKLYDRSPLHTLYADKYRMREVYKEKYGDEFLIDLVFKTTDWKDIKKENMPDFPFIIKPNHGSGWYHIIEDKETVDWNKIKTDCRLWLSQSAYLMQREWQYKNIPRMLIVEKLLICKNGGIPTNFRVHCYHGRVELIALTSYLSNDTELYTNQKYNRDWELLNIDWAHKDVDLNKIRDNKAIPRPKSFNKLIEIAETISKDFKYVRVDFFDVDGKLYHGEVTFHDGGGYERISPFEWDKKFGELLNLQK